MRAARTARLFFLTRPIKFLICGVVVAVRVVSAKAQLPIANCTKAAIYYVGQGDHHHSNIYLAQLHDFKLLV